MSGWNAYIDTITAGSAAVKRAAIVGLTDGSVWARTEGANVFSATEAELRRFVNHFNDLSSVPGTGADLENIHYIVPRTEDNLIFGKKDKSGFFAVKTKSAVLIAIYEGENNVSSEVRSTIEKMATYLESIGY